MALVTLVMIIALVQVMAFQWRVGKGRNKFGVPGPAMTGHPTWERYSRIHLNTIENLIVFVPLLYAFAYYLSPPGAAVLGLAFVVSRGIHSRAYLRDPGTRGIGAWPTGIALNLLALGSLVGVARALLRELW